MAKTWIMFGAVFGGLAVAMGAFAAHGLEDRLEPRRLANVETAAQYQMYHALALLVVGVMAMMRDSGPLRIAGYSFTAGVLLFSGSLYALALSGQTWLGAVTPFGGVAFLIGWTFLAIASAGAVRDRLE